MEKEINFQIDDISEELFILNKYTIDTLFKLENCANCIILYIFYYKTAKWQKTNIIKASDAYVKKSLNWGADKIKKTKKILKENGLIEIVQRRKNNKIDGWYIHLHYLVPEKTVKEAKIKVLESNNTQNQQVGNPTSRFQETNALRKQIDALREENNMLKEKIKSLKKKNIKKEIIKAPVKEILVSFSDDEELTNTLIEFATVRAENKTALTELGAKKLLTQLKKLSNDKTEQIEIINNSIINNWKSFFPLKNKPKQSNVPKKSNVPKELREILKF